MTYKVAEELRNRRGGDWRQAGTERKQWLGALGCEF